MLQLLLHCDLSLHLPPNTPTYQSDAHDTWSTLDLVFSTQDVAHAITKCQVLPDSRIPGADHLPVLTTVNTILPTIPPVTRLNCKDVDWPKYSDTFATHVTSLQLDVRPQPTTPQELDGFVKDLTLDFQLTSAKHAPKILPSPFAKRWWTPELTTLRKAYAQASRSKFTARNSKECPAAKALCRTARNRYTAILHHTKALHWKTWLENITESDVWCVSRYASGGPHDGSTQCIPTLHTLSTVSSAMQEFSTTAEKCSLLSSTFFPPKLLHVPSLPGDNGPFPAPLPYMMPSVEQVRHCIRKLRPNKAPGPDAIPFARPWPTLP